MSPEQQLPPVGQDAKTTAKSGPAPLKPMSIQPFIVTTALVASLVWIIVAIQEYGIKDVWRFAKYAPHQAFFMLVVFPLCSIFAGKAISLAVAEFPKYAKQSIQASVLEHYWPILLFVSLGLAGLAAGLEAVQQGRSPDKLLPKYAGQSVELIKKLEEEQQVALSDEAKTKIEESKIVSKKAFESFSNSPTLTDLEVLPDRAHLRALLDRNTQFILRIASPRVLLATQLQVFLGVFLFMWLLISCGLVAYTSRTVTLDATGNSLVSEIYLLAIFALTLLLLHPITYGAYRERVDAIVYPDLPLPGSFFIAVLASAAIAILVALDPAKDGGFYWYFLRGAPVGVMMVTFLVSKFSHGYIVHKTVGWEASIGSFSMVTLLMWIIFGGLCLLWPNHSTVTT